jgi:ABC-type uncharacterized transport system permease subunit
MYRGRGFSWLEKLSVVFAFIAAALAAYGAFSLIVAFVGRFSRRDELAVGTALIVFFATSGLMLKGIDAMKDERIRRLIKEAEERLERG